MCANVITYRGKSAAGETGKALGFDVDITKRLEQLVGSWEWEGRTDTIEEQFKNAGALIFITHGLPSILNSRSACSICRVISVSTLVA